MATTRLALCCLAAILAAVGCGGEEVGGMKAEPGLVIRKAYGGGRWFPGNASELKRFVSAAIDEADLPVSITGRVVAAISPHAGYAYSGKVAGYSFRALRDMPAAEQPETVVVLGLAHRGGFTGVAVMDGDAMETPVGRTELDKEAVEILVASSPRIRADYAPHAGEHSAENEVPFVQVALPGARLVVALIGDHDAATIDALVNALVTLAATRRVTVVASTDLLHDADYEKVTRTDRDTLRMICGLEDDALAAGWSYGHQLCCGIAPVLTAMRFARAQGCKEGLLLRYRNSGDDHPESRGQWVVGYGAVVFAAPSRSGKESK